MSSKIGIIQGRLSKPVNGKIQSFPNNTWKSEFYLAKEIGFEKHIEKIEKILRTKIVEKRMKKLSGRDIDNIIENKKTSKVKLGPNMLHEILDMLQVKH